jgi:heme-degrading monooxygenase HmoA
MPPVKLTSQLPDEQAPVQKHGISGQDQGYAKYLSAGILLIFVGYKCSRDPGLGQDNRLWIGTADHRPSATGGGTRFHSTGKKEKPMSVKVLITRTVPGNKGREMLQLFREMRSLATAQSGYISGETMKSNDRPDVFLVISTWESAGDWEKWLLSKERQAIQEKMDALLGGKTAYEMFNYGLRT